MATTSRHTTRLLLLSYTCTSLASFLSTTEVPRSVQSLVHHSRALGEGGWLHQAYTLTVHRKALQMGRGVVQCTQVSGSGPAHLRTPASTSDVPSTSPVATHSVAPVSRVPDPWPARAEAVERFVQKAQGATLALMDTEPLGRIASLWYKVGSVFGVLSASTPEKVVADAIGDPKGSAGGEWCKTGNSPLL